MLLFCFTSPRREQAARRALAAAPQAGSVRIATTAIDPSVTSPAGPVWLPLPARVPGQVRLAALGALPDPWQQYRAQRAREQREKQAREQALRAAQDDEDGPLS